MPFYLEEKDLTSELGDVRSVLIVPCRFCPAASLAVHRDEPYLDIPHHVLKTAPYERFIAGVRRDLEEGGIEVDVFRSRLVHQFVLCMWTAKRRTQLAHRAKDYDAVVVMGCEAAVETVREALGPDACPVVQGLRTEGVMSIQPRFSVRGTVRLDLQGISPTSFQEHRV